MRASAPERIDVLCPRCAGALEPAGGQLSARCPNCLVEYEVSDGVLVLDGQPRRQDYADNWFALLPRIEPRHFWFRARNDLIQSVLRECLGPLRGRTVLDVGCGGGFVLSSLEAVGMRTWGVDMHLAGLRVARSRVRGILVNSAPERVPFNGPFDAVLLCDVIEHLEDDVALLREAARVVAQDGIVLVTVPADPRLWTPLDDIAGHKRRYEREQLVAAMEAAGLRVILARHFTSLLFLAQMAQRRRLRTYPVTTDEERRALAERALAPLPWPIDAVASIVAAVDNALSRVGMPFGASIVAAGRHPIS